MLRSRQRFFIAGSAVFIIVAASLASTQYLGRPISSSTASGAPVSGSANFGASQAVTGASQTAAPTLTAFILPTETASSTVTPSPTVTSSPTDVPPTQTASATPTATFTPLLTATSTPASVSYTVVISDVYARREPSLKSPQLQLVPRGQAYTVQGQSPDGIWLQLDISGTKKANWVPAAFGLLLGPLDIVPLAGPTLAPTPSHTATVPVAAMADPLPTYPYLSPVTAHARDIYRYGLLLGNNPHTFIKVGDCQATTPYFLAAFDSSQSYRLGSQYAYLQETIKQFAGSFSRKSVAANTGFGSATVLDPQWADPKQCRAGESPLVCEYRVMRPSLALVSLGTNDAWQTNERYEQDLRHIIEYLIRQGVVPILSTKADNVEGDGRFNKLVKQLTAEYDLPLWDFWQVTRGLPGNGIKDSYHLSWGPAIFDDAKNMQLGWPWRNLTALQVLDAVWRAVR